MVTAHPQFVPTLERNFAVDLNFEVRLTTAQLREFWQCKGVEAVLLEGSLLNPELLATIPVRRHPLVIVNLPYPLPDNFAREAFCAVFNQGRDNLELRLWGSSDKHVMLLCSVLTGLSSGIRVDLNRGHFTDKEQEVLGLLLQGLRDEHIARALYISPKTVRNHVSNMLRKIGVDNRTQLVLWAIQRQP
jgi:DNA-binding CsgD family transcriptional regulator